MTVDQLAAKLGKNCAAIYRYENDAIEMPASLLKPLSEALYTEPADLMDWDELMRDEAERKERMNEILPLIGDGVTVEGESQKYILFKTPTNGGTARRFALTASIALSNQSTGTGPHNANCADLGRIGAVS